MNNEFLDKYNTLNLIWLLDLQYTLVGVSNGPILFSSARIALKNYISARLLALTTFLQVLTCSDFNIKCLVVHISLLCKKFATARLLASAHQDHSIPFLVLDVS